MRADIFVHPGYHAEWNTSLSNPYWEYEERLKEEAAASPLPIHVHDTKRGWRTPNFNWMRFFEDRPSFPTLPQMGELADKRGVQRLMEILNNFNISDLRIHGSYLEMCVHDFVCQIEDELGSVNVDHGRDLEPTMWMNPQCIGAVTVVSFGQVLSCGNGWGDVLTDRAKEQVSERLCGYTTPLTVVHAAEDC